MKTGKEKRRREGKKRQGMGQEERGEATRKGDDGER